eukprot:s2454_g11.t1
MVLENGCSRRTMYSAGLLAQVLLAAAQCPQIPPAVPAVPPPALCLPCRVPEVQCKEPYQGEATFAKCAANNTVEGFLLDLTGGNDCDMWGKHSEIADWTPPNCSFSECPYPQTLPEGYVRDAAGTVYCAQGYEGVNAGCAELLPGQSCRVNCLAPFEGPGLEVRCPADNTEPNREPLRLSEPNCSLPCPVPEPLPYGYTNRSGEWRCEEGYSGEAKFICVYDGLPFCQRRVELRGCYRLMPCADLQLPPEVDECELNLTDCQGVAPGGRCQLSCLTPFVDGGVPQFAGCPAENVNPYLEPIYSQLPRCLLSCPDPPMLPEGYKKEITFSGLSVFRCDDGWVGQVNRSCIHFPNCSFEVRFEGCKRKVPCLPLEVKEEDGCRMDAVPPGESCRIFCREPYQGPWGTAHCPQDNVDPMRSLLPQMPNCRASCDDLPVGYMRTSEGWRCAEGFGGVASVTRADCGAPLEMRGCSVLQPCAIGITGVTVAAISSNASLPSTSTWSWDCDSPRWQRLWASTAAALGLATADESFGALRWTQRQEEPWCPVAVAASRLAHCILTFRRDWHGDILKLKARPIHMLQIPMKQDLQLILQPQVLLPKDSKGLQWHLLLFDAVGKLSSLLCPVAESGIALDYDFYCQQRPWAFGCAEGLPSCNSTARWRKSPSELRQCGERGTTSNILQCLRSGMPHHPKRFLDLLVPSQFSWWQAVSDTLRGRIGRVGRRRPQPAPCGAAVAREYLAAALCPLDAVAAPSDGYADYTEVFPGHLEAMTLAATARELPGCGVEMELHLQVGELQAPTVLEPCEGVACREQCATWEASNYLRFSCGAGGMAWVAATGSGHATEPALHTILQCRLPWRVLPKWLGGRAADPNLFLELRELDGVFSKPIQLKVCPYQRPKTRQNIAFCVRPVFGAVKISQLLDDWLIYHRMMGLEHVFLYDLDGSLEPLLLKGAPAALHQNGRLTYIGNFSHRMGVRVHGLNQDFWRRDLSNICLETQQANHCLALARSAGFEWFVFLRGLDKFLHSEADRSPGMVRRVLHEAHQQQIAFFQVLRRHCGARDPEAMRNAAGISAEVGLPVPVFSQYQRCEPIQLSIDDPLRDDSWVPIMKAAEVDLLMTNMAVDFNKSGFSMPFLPIRRLRAQHFVRAFEVDGKSATERAYAPSLTDAARFTELDVEMDWAVAELPFEDLDFFPQVDPCEMDLSDCDFVPPGGRCVVRCPEGPGHELEMSQGPKELTCVPKCTEPDPFPVEIAKDPEGNWACAEGYVGNVSEECRECIIKADPLLNCSGILNLTGCWELVPCAPLVLDDPDYAAQSCARGILDPDGARLRVSLDVGLEPGESCLVSCRDGLHGESSSAQCSEETAEGESPPFLREWPDCRLECDSTPLGYEKTQKGWQCSPGYAGIPQASCQPSSRCGAELHLEGCNPIVPCLRPTFGDDVCRFVADCPDLLQPGGSCMVRCQLPYEGEATMAL